METKSNVIVFCLYYDQRTRRYIDEHYSSIIGDWLYPVEIPATTKYMENTFYITWLPENKDLWESKDYVGVVSWKFDQKIRVPDLSSYGGGEDFVGFYLQRANMIQHSQTWHPRFISSFPILLQKMGYPLHLIMSPNVPYIVYNYWMCKPHWMDRYITFLKKVMDLMENWEDVQEALYADAKFEIPPHLKVEDLMRIFNRPYYTHHCFVLERMAGFYFWAEGATMKALQSGP